METSPTTRIRAQACDALRNELAPDAAHRSGLRGTRDGVVSSSLPLPRWPWADPRAHAWSAPIMTA